MNDLKNLTLDDISQGIKIGKSALDALPGVKQVIADSVGILIGDPISGARRKRNIRRQLEMAAMEIELQEKKVELDKLTYADASRVFEASADEDRKELQALWATLIAKMLTGQLRTVRSAWLEAIRNLEPIDALILPLIGSPISRTMERMEWVGIIIYKLRKAGINDIPSIEIDLSLSQLEKLGLIEFFFDKINPDLAILGKSVMRYTSLGSHILTLVTKDEPDAPKEPAST